MNKARPDPQLHCFSIRIPDVGGSLASLHFTKLKPHSTKTIAFGFHIDVKTSRAGTLPLHIGILGLVNFMGTSIFHILLSRPK